ncbi:MAG: RNA 2',3'-cyclic phosphodiesterase [Candidatus Methanoplasma sp.]|jgi:2'-5' RNA ligase|nr:RNA 2',3'-cyclic phosphodiesterase [Candidatus Methanoplasma sp.]
METIRSFVSFKIPEMPAVTDAQEKLRGTPGVSVPKEVHLTLRFLGDVEQKKIGKLSERMRSLEGYEAFGVSLKGIGAFPNNKDPRVVWIGAELGDPFPSILSDLDGMLGSLSIKYDKKPFKAHVTIGRVRTPSRSLTEFLDGGRGLEAGSFVCSEIFLMSSDLTPKGAVHSVIDPFRLSGV